MKRIEFNNCLGCPFYTNESETGEAPYGLCTHINSNRYNELYPGIFIDDELKKQNRDKMHDPYEFPEWCPIEDVI